MVTESFSEQLRQEAEPIWEEIFHNPFLQQISDAALPLEKFRYYLTQDYLYLEGFARAVALALAKAPDAASLESLAHRVLTPVERPLHHRLMEVAGLSMEGLQAARPSPTNLAYINHMVRTASEEGLGATAAALLPCPWTYHLLGELLLPTEHPVYSLWTSFYTEGGLEHSVAAWRSYVDTEAAQAGPRERESMRRAFITSSRYEWMFWRMAYQMEAWPV